MLFYIISALINAVVSTILGVVVYFKNRKEFTNKIFAVFCFVVAVWSYSYFVWLLLKDKSVVLINHRIFLMGASIFIVILFFHSVLSFTNKVKNYKKFLISGYSIFSFFLLVDYFTPFFIKNVERELIFEFWPKPGIFLHPFLIIWYFYLLFAIYILVKEIKGSYDNISYNAQLKYILAGTIIGFGGAALNYFLWYGIQIPPITNFLVSVGMITIAFGIVKHHLFNIKILTSELLVFISWFFVIVRSALSQNTQELWANIVLMLLMFVIGTFLIRSVSREVASEKKLLEEAQKNLEFEKKLHQALAEVSEKRAKIKF